MKAHHAQTLASMREAEERAPKPGDRIEADRGGPLEYGTVFDQGGWLWVKWDNGGFVLFSLLVRDCALQGTEPKVIR